jgi:hypothetical protein
MTELSKNLERPPMDPEGTEICDFPAAGSGGLTIFENRGRTGYTFRVKGRRNHFTFSDGEAIELARTILDRMGLS